MAGEKGKVTRLIFGGLVAVILLGFYAYSIVHAVRAAYCLSSPPCKDYTAELNEGYTTILSLVGGLVSALVIAVLAVTPAGKPLGVTFTDEGEEGSNKAVTIVTTAYIFVWLICGVMSVIIGFIKYPDIVPALTAAAKSWLGLAVAAAYSYLGVQPTSSSKPQS